MKFRINWGKFANFLTVVVLAAVFFVATSSFNYLTQDSGYIKWTSPDETANYFFAKLYSQTGTPAYFDEAAVVGDNLIMPRSLRSDFGWVKPVSFLGIILTYGRLGAIFGAGVIPFLTPLFASLGIVVFYLLVRRIFASERIALISAALLASFPVYVYYTARSMFHNVLFIVFLIFAAYFLLIALGKRRELKIKEEFKQRFFSWKIDHGRFSEIAFALLSGLAAGLAAITRSSELIWLIPSFFLIWIFYARRFGLIKLLVFLIGIFLAVLPVLYWNNALYQNFWRGGYNEMNRSVDKIVVSTDKVLQASSGTKMAQYREYLSTVKNTVFYFGFKPEQSREMFEHYVLEMFPLLVYLGALGLAVLIVKMGRRFPKKYLVYLLVWSLSGVILVYYYGSWKFNDNPNPNSYTIGNSYTRYWLPIYLMLLPFVAYAIDSVARALSLTGVSNPWHPSRIRSLIGDGLRAAATLGLSAISIIFVLFGSEEGLAYTYHTNLAERRIAEQVFSLTEKDSIIITQYYDKFFFPERRVIVGRLPNEEILAAAVDLVRYYPLYYYNFYLDDEDVSYLNSRKFAPYNLKMSLVKKTNANFGLYRLEALEEK